MNSSGMCDCFLFYFIIFYFSNLFGESAGTLMNFRVLVIIMEIEDKMISLKMDKNKLGSLVSRIEDNDDQLFFNQR